jgi:hypothetical protein
MQKIARYSVPWVRLEKINPDPYADNTNKNVLEQNQKWGQNGGKI